MYGRLAFFSLAFASVATVIGLLLVFLGWIIGSEQESELTLSSLEYDRAAFGSWVDNDGDCLNTRAEILLEQSLSSPVLDESGCRVTGGTWLDAYTGDVISDPSSIDVDHLVPLRFAWMTGASVWTETDRIKFMNDSRNLVLTTASINRSKGAATPLNWLPPDDAARCGFVQLFLSVVLEYDLTLTDPEAIHSLELQVCN